ncbi:MAG: CopG family transcriptional regulator [Halobacteriota archaeon]|nr:CopG family transcriptional regulator [Halobacteriota archaeon]
MSKGEEEQVNKTVLLRSEIYNTIEERIKDLDFTSVDEYVEFVMTEILKDDDDEEVTFTQEEEEEVKNRLKALGYLD